MAEMTLMDWLTIAEAAKRLETSERTIERRIAAGDIETRPRRREGKRPETVCYPRDIAKLMPPLHIAGGEEACGEIMPVPRSGLETIGGALARWGILSSRRSGKCWLTLTEASETSGLSVRFLRRLIRSGQILAVRDRAWKIDRMSLETWQPRGEGDSRDNAAGPLALLAGGEA